MKTVLVVDDEPSIAQIASDYLRHGGFSVLTASNGVDALALARAQRPDLIVLDLGLPRMDGIEVAKTLRREGNVPIIMLTMRIEESDRLAGLELGADDYMTKPFSPRELLARIETVLRRTTRPRGEAPRGVIEAGPLRIDIGGRRVFLSGEEVRLTRTEFDLLAELAARRGEALPHETLLEKVWGPEYRGENHYLKVYIGRLRDKLEDDASEPRLIVNVRGVGYRLNAP